MSNLRFTLFASALFAAAFAGVSWGPKVFPLVAMRAAMPAPEPRAAAPASQPQIVEEAQSEPEPRLEAKLDLQIKPKIDPKIDPKPQVLTDPEPIKPAPSQADSGRSQIRLTAIQAANAYTLTPCDRAVKSAFIIATATYIKSMSGGITGDGAIQVDARVRTAVEAALRIGGVHKDEFPAGIPLWSTAVARSANDAGPCSSGRRAENVRR